MTDNREFETRFVRFLEDTGFPAGASAEQTLTNLDSMVNTLATRLCGMLGTKLTIADLASQSGPVKGGPHRLDLLVHYSMVASGGRQTAAAGRSGIND